MHIYTISNFLNRFGFLHFRTNMFCCHLFFVKTVVLLGSRHIWCCYISIHICIIKTRKNINNQKTSDSIYVTGRSNWNVNVSNYLTKNVFVSNDYERVKVDVTQLALYCFSAWLSEKLFSTWHNKKVINWQWQVT